MPTSAAARPLLRPGTRLVLEQLSRSTRHAQQPTWNIRQYKRPSICLSCTIFSRGRLYSTSPQSSNEPSSTTPGSVTRPDATPTSSNRRSELPSAADSRRSQLSQRFSMFMDNLQSRVLVASQTLNDLTGYSAIDAIKAANAKLEAELATAQTTLRTARQTYKSVNTQRSSTQREVTALLARKDTWSPTDLERFTTLYRLDHELDGKVAEAAAALTEAEADETRLSQALNAGILRRYHEEQVWSDRIRRQSTWGTWGLMGINVLLFLMLQFVAEPWKRNRLMRGIAAEEKRALEEVRKELADVRDALAATQVAETPKSVPVAVPDVGPGAAEAVANAGKGVLQAEQPSRQSWKELLLAPERWQPALLDLYSDRRIDLRMRDASLIAIEGAISGAAVMAAIGVLLLRRS